MCAKNKPKTCFVRFPSHFLLHFAKFKNPSLLKSLIVKYKIMSKYLYKLKKYLVLGGSLEEQMVSAKIRR